MQIDYKGKGYFSGKSHSFKASVSKGSHTIQTYEGQWTGIATVGGSKGHVFLDTSATKEEVTVKPIEQQGEWESRNLWEKVAKGIRTGNYDAAAQDKTRIEVCLFNQSLVEGSTEVWFRRTSNDNGGRMKLPLGIRGSLCDSVMWTRIRNTRN